MFTDTISRGTSRTTEETSLMPLTLLPFAIAGTAFWAGVTWYLLPVVLVSNKIYLASWYLSNTIYPENDSWDKHKNELINCNFHTEHLDFLIQNCNVFYTKTNFSAEMQSIYKKKTEILIYQHLKPPKGLLQENYFNFIVSVSKIIVVLKHDWHS